MKKSITVLSIAALGLGLSTSANAIDAAGVDIHGFASQGFVYTKDQDSFIAGNSGDGSFNFNEFGANFSKQVTPDVRIGLQVFAQDRGNYGKDDIQLDWAYGDYRFADYLGFRAGKIKNPIGLYNETRDTDSLRTSILLPQGIYADAQRESAIAISGGGIYGTLPAGSVGAFAYQIQVGVLPMETEGGTAQQLNYKANSSTSTKVVGTNTVTTTGTNTAHLTSAGSDTTVLHHLEWRPPIDGLRLTVTGIHTNTNFEVEDTARIATTTQAGVTTAAFVPRSNSISNKHLHKYLFSGEYTFRDLVVAGEYMRQDFDANSTASVFLNKGTTQVMSKSTPTKRDSWYVGATYRINDLLELGTYYNEYYANRDVRSADYQKDSALSLRIDPLKNVVLKVEGHYIKGTALLLEPVDKSNPNDDWLLFAAKATYSF